MQKKKNFVSPSCTVLLMEDADVLTVSTLDVGGGLGYYGGGSNGGDKGDLPSVNIK